MWVGPKVMKFEQERKNGLVREKEVDMNGYGTIYKRKKMVVNISSA